MFAYAVSDRELLFHDWLFDHRIELGEFVGNIITWRPIGNPKHSDEIYRNQRTPELVAIEDDQSQVYRKAVQGTGLVGKDQNGS